MSGRYFLLLGMLLCGYCKVLIGADEYLTLQYNKAVSRASSCFTSMMNEGDNVAGFDFVNSLKSASSINRRCQACEIWYSGPRFLSGLSEDNLRFYYELDNCRGATPLLIAAYLNDVNNVKKLVESGADPNMTTHESFTPLFFALIHRNESMAETLLRNGADPLVITMFGETAFSFVDLCMSEEEAEKFHILLKKYTRLASIARYIGSYCTRKMLEVTI